MDLNITRPAVLRQYYGMETSICEGKAARYTYGSGTGTISVGMDPDNFVTRSMNKEMLEMSSHIYKMLCENKTFPRTGFTPQRAQYSNVWNIFPSIEKVFID